MVRAACVGGQQGSHPSHINLLIRKAFMQLYVFQGERGGAETECDTFVAVSSHRRRATMHAESLAKGAAGMGAVPVSKGMAWK